MTSTLPDEFCPVLSSLLAECGIALVYLPHIKSSFLHGVTFIDKNKIILGLTTRGKDADRFWFSLFHELGHILLEHINKAGFTTDEEENEADNFARKTLIPDQQYCNFVERKDFSLKAIKKFAESIEIDAGIVAGRLQNDGYIDYSWHRSLKTKYTTMA